MFVDICISWKLKAFSLLYLIIILMAPEKLVYRIMKNTAYGD